MVGTAVYQEGLASVIQLKNSRTLNPGVQKIDAVGAVYNLDDLSKFAGKYVEARTGITVGSKSKGYLALSNQHGVIMELKFSGKGLAMSTGVDGMVVSLK